MNRLQRGALLGLAAASLMVVTGWASSSHGQAKEYTLEQVASAKQAGREARTVTFSPDSKKAVVGWTYRSIVLLGEDNVGKPLASFTTFNDAAEDVTSEAMGYSAALAFSPDGKTLAFDDSGSVRTWNAEARRLTKTKLPHQGQVVLVGFLPDGKHVVTASLDKNIRVWNLESGKEVRRIVASDKALVSAAVSNDAKRIAALVEKEGAADNPKKEFDVRIWETETGNEVGKLTPTQNRDLGAETPAAVAISPDGARVAVAYVESLDTPKAQVWDVKEAKVLYSLRGGTDTNADSVCVAFSPDGKLIASAGSSGWLNLWDASSGKHLVRPLPGHNGSKIYSIAFNGVSDRLISASAEKVLIWKVTQK